MNDALYATHASVDEQLWSVVAHDSCLQKLAAPDESQGTGAANPQAQQQQQPALSLLARAVSPHSSDHGTTRSSNQLADAVLSTGSLQPQLPLSLSPTRLPRRRDIVSLNLAGAELVRHLQAALWLLPCASDGALSPLYVRVYCAWTLDHRRRSLCDRHCVSIATPSRARARDKGTEHVAHVDEG